MGPIHGVRDYWRLLSTPARLYGLIQVGVLSGAFLGLAFEPLAAERSLGQSMGAELIELTRFLLFWCGWSEQLFSLRRAIHPAQTQSFSPGRRLILFLYGGLLFLAVLSLLSAVNPLLGVGAIFFLFTSVEALDASLASQPVFRALLGGLRRSFEIISSEALPFVGKLLLPGIVLMITGMAVAQARLWSLEQAGASQLCGWLLTLTLLGVWLTFLILAQLEIQLKAMEMAVPQLTPNPSADQPTGANKATAEPRALMRVRELARRFEGWSTGLAASLGIAVTLWVVVQLGRNNLLTESAFVLAFQAVVVQVTSIVQAFLDLLLKLGFLSLVMGVIVGLALLVIGLGRGRLLSMLKKLVQACQSGLQGVARSLATDLKLTGATLGLGTLITALSTVAVQTYANVQKVKQEAQQQEKVQQEEKVKLEQQNQERKMRLDELEKRFDLRLTQYLSQAKASDPSYREAFISDLRSILHEINQYGDTDGERKGQLLRNLYESGQLTPPTAACGMKLRDHLRQNPNLGRIKQKEAEINMMRAIPGCLPGVFLDSMDFSQAKLNEAFLENAFLPFISLRGAKLRGANLKGANLSFATMEHADLSQANLEEASLRDANFVGADLAGVILTCADVSGVEAFYAHVPPEAIATLFTRATCTTQPLTSGIVSWGFAKGNQVGSLLLLRGEQKAGKPSSTTAQAKPDLTPIWTFCPLDAENALWPHETEVEAGAKCMNRQFIGGKDGHQALPSQRFAYENRNWSGGIFENALFQGLLLKNVKLIGANLQNARFVNVRLHSVQLTGANLQNAIFSDSSLDDVDFTGANLTGIKFERVRSRNIQLRGALHDRQHNLGSYNDDNLRRNAFRSDDFDKRILNEPDTFRQDVLTPAFFAPVRLRPLHLLFWMVATPSPLPMHGWRSLQ